MKCAIFGTGNYYKRYCRYINDEDVLFLLDNDESKWGKILNGKEVLPPERLKSEEYDFIIVMVMQYERIEAQLISYGVPKEKIKYCHDIPELFGLTMCVEGRDGKCDIELWKENHFGKTIFVCVSEFSRTGVPVATMHVCKMLKGMGYKVLASALLGGTLEEELYENEIDYISDVGLFYKNDVFLKVLREFDMIFLGGIGVSEFGLLVAEFDMPIVWWLHESKDEYFEKYKLAIRDNIHYYAGGKRVVNKFKQFYENGTITEMLYFLPEIEEPARITFAVIGSIISRKGQDIFVRAVKQINEENMYTADFLLVGSCNSTKYFDEINEQIQNIDNIEIIDEMSQKELEIFYQKIDVLVCPSRDDPMPIVVTQAFQKGIPCIVSDQVGQCEYLIDGKAGDVFYSEDVDGLKKMMCKYISDKELIERKGKEAKKLFSKYFSEATMKGNLENIINELM